MHTLSTRLTKQEKHAHNEIAAVLSIVPGLGHIYKGHYAMGLMWMFLGMPIAVFVGIISILVLQVLVYSCQSGAGQLLGMTPTMRKTGVIIII